jgi:hypothetical protein
MIAQANQFDAQTLAAVTVAVANALQNSGQRTRYKSVVGSTPTGVNAHGPGGLFSPMGMNKPLFSAMLLPMQGLGAQLPSRFSNEMDPLYGLITGVSSSSGTNPVNKCDDPKTAGTMKLCTHSFPFGFLSRGTRIFDIKTAGQTINRGEFTDLMIYGGLEPNSPLVPTLPGAPNMTGAAGATVLKAIYEMGVTWIVDFARMVYNGDPTNNTAGGGYEEFIGLDKLINTGYRDAKTGVTCPAADSIVQSFGNVVISLNSTTAALICRKIRSIYRQLNFLARHANLWPVNWKLSMSFSLFYELTEIWPVAYTTTQASVIPTGATLMVSDDAKIRMRDEMRGSKDDLYGYSGQFLWIDGEKVPVSIDDAIVETQNAGGTFTSEIYFVPMTVLGNQPVCFWEHFNFDGPNAAMQMADVMAPPGFYNTSDGGRFLWEKRPPNNGCVALNCWTEPRLMLLTPYLAARLTNVSYAPLGKERSWDPTDPSFYISGGNSAGDSTDPSYYTPTV